MGQDCSKILTNAGGGAGRPPCPSDDVDAKGAEIACARRSRLAMDWADGAKFKDFLGFAILRSPGFHLGEKDGYSLTRSASRLRDPVRSRCQATSRLYRSFCGGIPRLRRPTGERNSPTRSRPCVALVRWTSSFMMKPRQPVEVPDSHRRARQYLDRVQPRRSELTVILDKVSRSRLGPPLPNQ